MAQIKESACQSRDEGLIPGLGRSHVPPRAPNKPRHHSYWVCAPEPGSHPTEPTHPRACSLQPKKSPQWEACGPQESRPHSLQLETTYTATSTQHNQKLLSKFRKKKKKGHLLKVTRWGRLGFGGCLFFWAVRRHYLRPLPGQRAQSFVPCAQFPQKPCCSAEQDLLPGVLAETWLTPEEQMARAELPTAAPSLLVPMPVLRVRKQYKAYVSKNSKPKQGTTTVCVFFHTSKSGLGKMEKT